jgi:oligoendopeptidase F
MEALRFPAVETALRLALDELESQLEMADRAYADAQWRGHFREADADELVRLEEARAALLLDDQARAVLGQWESQPRDPLLARRVTVLLRRFRWAEIESQPRVYRLRNRIDQTVINYRPKINGATASRVERSQLLRCHPDRDRRREAWLAMAPLADQIEADVRELMRQRQNLARERGHDGFVSWALDMMGLDRKWVVGFFDELRRRTEAPYQTWLAEAAQHLPSRDGCRPWDLAFSAEQGMSVPEAAFPRDGALPAARAVADGLGLREAAAGVRVSLADIPYAALCYAVHPPDDVRILVSPRDGRVHYDALFHEFGHALHWRCLRPSSPILRWEASPFNEAMACLWERLAVEPEWLMRRDNIPVQRVAGYRQGWARRTVYRLRLRLAQAIFEYQAYDALDDDLSALFRDVFSEYLGVPFDQSAGWADNPFWTSHPVYLQNYVIGEAVASQTLAALRQQFGRLIDRPEVGTWLVENYYAPGAALPWAQKLVYATGASLQTSDLLADLGCELGKASANV